LSPHTCAGTTTPGCARGSAPGCPREYVYAETLADLQAGKRLKLEVAALDRLRTSERAAADELQAACRARVAELGAEVERAARLSTWKTIGVFVVGALVGAVGAVAARPARP
jgi:hypothetical protein